jgi:hypothetical protein
MSEDHPHHLGSGDEWTYSARHALTHSRRSDDKIVMWRSPIVHPGIRR